MTCQTCGAALPTDAKFCPECGTPVPVEEVAPTEVIEPVAAEPSAEVDGSPAVAPEDVDVAIVDPADPVDAPPTTPEPDADDDVDEDAAEPAERREYVASPALPRDETATGVTSPALQQEIPTPPKPPKPKRERRSLEERGAWEEFMAAIVPLVRNPRFSGNLLAALVALVISFAAALLIWLLLDNAFEEQAGLLLPGFVDTSEDGFGVLALIGLLLHQVVMVNGDDSQHLAPLLLALVPLAGCAIGVRVARRSMPCSGRPEGFLTRTLPFALLYGLFLFIWSLFGAEGWHAAHVRSFLAGIAFALLGAWVAERFLLRPSEAPAAATSPPAATEHRGRFTGSLRAGARVFALMVLAGSLLWLVPSIIATVEGNDESARGTAVASTILHVLEGGFEAVGFGVGAEGDPFGANEDDEGWRVFELDEVIADSAAVLFIIIALLVVLVGGLFSGFAIARNVQPRSRNDHALFGAVTGVVWALGMFLAHFLVLNRYEFDEDTLTSFDGVELVFSSLLVGAVLGALGGLLAAHAHTAPASIESAASAVSDDDAPTEVHET